MNDYPIDEWEWFGKLNNAFFTGLLLDIITISIVVWLIYFRKYRKKEFLFAFYLFNIIIYTITFLLNRIELSVGAALGLFAVFSMLRYRTESLGTKDMSYLFISIAIGLTCASQLQNFQELAVMCAIIVVFVYTFERNWFLRNEMVREILYERVDLISANHQKEMMEDLRRRTGLNIHRFTIGEVYFDRSFAMVNLYYYEK